MCAGEECVKQVLSPGRWTVSIASLVVFHQKGCWSWSAREAHSVLCIATTLAVGKISVGFCSGCKGEAYMGGRTLLVLTTQKWIGKMRCSQNNFQLFGKSVYQMILLNYKI